MTTYDGPATVIADGAEYEVTAKLSTIPGREWYGSLDVPDGDAAWAIFNTSDRTLRIGDREASFVAKGAGTDMVITGSGRPPFGT